MTGPRRAAAFTDLRVGQVVSFNIGGWRSGEIRQLGRGYADVWADDTWWAIGAGRFEQELKRDGVWILVDAPKQPASVPYEAYENLRRVWDGPRMTGAGRMSVSSDWYNQLGDVINELLAAVENNRPWP